MILFYILLFSVCHLQSLSVLLYYAFSLLRLLLQGIRFCGEANANKEPRLANAGGKA